MFMEIATEKGYFNGYLSPLFEDVEVGEDPDGGILRSIWESLVDAAGSILESPGEEEIATRIPLSGELEDPVQPVSGRLCSHCSEMDLLKR
jgi:hypothetical protein